VPFDQRSVRLLRARVAATVAGAAALAALAAGCSTHSKNSPLPSTPNPASSAANAAPQLAALAEIAREATYTAVYNAESSDAPGSSRIITVFRTAARIRIDVTEAPANVIIQVDPTGTYFCTVPTSGKASCYTLAGPGQPVPSNVDPSGQALFTTTLDVLAQGVNLTVADAPTRPAANGIPESTCFALIAAPAGGAAPGTYCFTTTGVLTRVQFRSNALQLISLAGAPKDSDFTLPMAPLPFGSATPSGIASSVPGGPASNAPSGTSSPGA
jgi:hypothetical protein